MMIGVIDSTSDNDNDNYNDNDTNQVTCPINMMYNVYINMHMYTSLISINIDEHLQLSTSYEYL